MQTRSFVERHYNIARLSGQAESRLRIAENEEKVDILWRRV